MSAAKTNLRAVNAALLEAVLEDQRAYAPLASARAARAAKDLRGVCQMSVDPTLISASTVLVSALMPKRRLTQAGNIAIHGSP